MDFTLVLPSEAKDCSPNKLKPRIITNEDANFFMIYLFLIDCLVL